MSAVLTMGAGMAWAQEEGPILLPKPKPVAKPASATLLVICDLTCNWKLDGETKGHIEAGGSAKAKVELGQHMVIAVTEDGVDQVKQLVKAEEKGQTVISIELRPVRETRLTAEQAAKEKAAQEAREKAALEKEARHKAAQVKAEQEARDKAAREKATKRQADAAVAWIDPVTGLMWTRSDNGKKVDWHNAKGYCSSLRLADYQDWRVPTIDELEGIYDPGVAAKPHIKGGLQLTYSLQWSDTQGEKPWVSALVERVHPGKALLEI